MNKRNRNNQPRRLTKFERETERRRKDMLRELSAAKPKIKPAFLRLFDRRQRLFLLAKREVRA